MSVLIPAYTHRPSSLNHFTVKCTSGKCNDKLVQGLKSTVHLRNTHTYYSLPSLIMPTHTLSFIPGQTNRFKPKPWPSSWLCYRQLDMQTDRYKMVSLSLSLSLSLLSLSLFFPLACPGFQSEVQVTLISLNRLSESVQNKGFWTDLCDHYVTAAGGKVLLCPSP